MQTYGGHILYLPTLPRYDRYLGLNDGGAKLLGETRVGVQPREPWAKPASEKEFEEEEEEACKSQKPRRVSPKCCIGSRNAEICSSNDQRLSTRDSKQPTYNDTLCLVFTASVRIALAYLILSL